MFIKIGVWSLCLVVLAFNVSGRSEQPAAPMKAGLIGLGFVLKLLFRQSEILCTVLSC